MKRKKPSKGSGSPSFANPEIGQIEQLLRFMSEHNLEEFEYSRGDLRIRLKKPGANVVYAAPRPSAEIIVPSAVAAGAAENAAPAGAESEVRGGEDLQLVKSPIVGTFYESASPGAPAFVSVGDRVQPGKVLCIIESMKLMNEIEAETSGIIERKLVLNGQPVEYGEALFAIRAV